MSGTMIQIVRDAICTGMREEVLDRRAKRLKKLAEMTPSDTKKLFERMEEGIQKEETKYMAGLK